MGFLSSVFSIHTDREERHRARDTMNLDVSEKTAKKDLDIRGKDTNKFYNDLGAKNLLEKQLSTANAKFGAYGISSTKGSAKAFADGIKKDAKNETDKRNKIFKINSDIIDHNYNFGVQKDLLSYQQKADRLQESQWSTAIGMGEGYAKSGSIMG